MCIRDSKEGAAVFKGMEREINKIIQVKDYINEDLESELFKLIPYKKQKGCSRNQILRWGARNPYFHGYQGKEIPAIFDQFRKDIDFNSVTINSYYQGQKIPYHVDDFRAGKEIVILSLLSTSTMDFRFGSRIISHELPRFSLTRISEEIRTQWEHSVIALDNRVSIVFRKCT